ncbi:MAG: penicillin-binding protein 1C [Spirochaetia bacterium]
MNFPKTPILIYKAFLLLAGSALIILLYILLIPLPPGPFPEDYSLVVQSRDGQVLRVYLNSEEQWILPPREQNMIPEKLITCVTRFEDRYFYRHPGVNPGAIVRAIYQNLTSGERISGASTITMQITRLIKPKRRTVPNKLLEMLQALKIELLYTKNEIMALYMNHAPYGGNIYGYRTASYRYYGKEPAELTWAEAATLAVLPNAPGLISPETAPEALQIKRNRLLKSLYSGGILDDETLKLALTEPIPEGVIPFPVTAPHLADRVRRETGKTSGYLVTTVDYTIQKGLERMLKYHAGYLSRLGIKNSFALIIENETGAVRGYAGSQDFFNDDTQGQIDGITSLRSTGSLLKPFLYALAMDEGQLLPETRIIDIPSQFGAFSPKNMNQEYSGLATVERALIQSLNVPAVRILHEYGLEGFYYFLEHAGISTLFRRPQDYGLPLILGGAEARGDEIAELFRGLAKGGEFGPIHYIEGTSSENNTRLISPGAAYLTLEILKEVKRPGSEAFWNRYTGAAPLAWKTGTSYGQRDAWAAGVNPEWTIVTWSGNFTGEENPNLTSTSEAGKLLFDIFNFVTEGENPAWFLPPEGELVPVKTCLETGYRAGRYCDRTTVVMAPGAAQYITECPYHSRIYVTEDEQFRVTSLCWEPGNYKPLNVLVYPPGVSYFLSRSGTGTDTIPPLKEGCAGTAANPLEIIYPAEGAHLYIPRELTGELQKIPVRAAHREEGRKIFWYLNGEYLGTTLSDHSKPLVFSPGLQHLELVDDTGNRAKVSFSIDLKRE